MRSPDLKGSRVFAALAERRAHVRNLLGETRCLGLPKALTCRDQSVERLARLPVKSVHCPRSDSRFERRLDEIRVACTPTLLQPFGKRVARSSELCKREPEQRVKIILAYPSSRHPSARLGLITKGSLTALDGVPDGAQ
jgi:hypothetical protein